MAAKLQGLARRQTAASMGTMAASARSAQLPASTFGSTAKLLTCTSPPAMEHDAYGAFGHQKHAPYARHAQHCWLAAGLLKQYAHAMPSQNVLQQEQQRPPLAVNACAEVANS